MIKIAVSLENLIKKVKKILRSKMKATICRNHFMNNNEIKIAFIRIKNLKKYISWHLIACILKVYRQNL